MMALAWAKVQGYVYVALAVLAAIAAGIGYGWLKGREHAAGKVRKATQRAADATATTKAYRSRAKVDADVNAMPDRADDPDSSRARLKRYWTRK